MTIARRTMIGILVVACLGPGLAQPRGEEAQSTSGSLTTGAQGVIEDPADSAKFYEYRDVPGGFVAERFVFTWAPRSELFLGLDVFDVAQRDTRGRFEFGRRDLWKGYVTWNNNPRRWGDDTRMLFAHQGQGLFTLDDTLQAAVQAAPASVDTTPMDGEWDTGTKGFLIKNAILQSAQDVDLGFQRRSFGLGFDVTPTRSWTFGAGWTRESRSGTTPQPLGMTFSQSPAEVAAPVDFQTDWESLRAEFTRRNWNVGVQISGSQFDTRYDRLAWDNQLSLVDQAVSASLSSTPGRSQLTLWTDNEMVQGTVYGGVNLPGRTRIDATISRSETTQDDEFLPMTINANLAALLAPLPEDSFDGKHRNNLVNLRLSGRPTAWFRWGAWGRWQELENESPGLLFVETVTTDASIPRCSNANACGATTNRLQRMSLPYGFEKDNLGAMVGFRPLRWLDLSLSYDRQDQKREFSAVEDSSDDTWKLTADFDVAEWATVKTTLQTQRRRADEYHVHYLEESFPIGEAYIAPFNLGIRRFTWTDRDRDSASLYFELTPAPRWSIYGEATYAESEYLDPETGRQIGESFTVMEDRDFDTVLETYEILLAGRVFDRNNTYTLGISFSPHERVDLFADYTWERFRYELASRFRTPVSNVGSDDPLDDWGSAAEDTYKTLSAGVSVGLDGKKAWKATLTATRSEGTGDITTSFVPGGNASGNTTLTEFPRLDTTLTIATLDVTHHVRPNVDVTVRYWYEDWDEDNWAGDQMQPYMGDPGNDPGSVQSIFLGMDFDNYTYHVVSCLLNYRW